MNYSHKYHNLWDDVRFSSMVYPCIVYTPWSRFVHYQVFFLSCSCSAHHRFHHLFLHCTNLYKVHGLHKEFNSYSGLCIVWNKLNKNISHQNINDKWILRNMCNIVFMAFFCSFIFLLVFSWFRFSGCLMFNSQKLPLPHMMVSMFVCLFF